MDFLIIILTILLIYFGFKILMRLLLPLLLKYASKKMEKKFREGFGGPFQQQPNNEKQTKEGETIIDKSPQQTKRNATSTKKVGEYIDFEEID